MRAFMSFLVVFIAFGLASCQGNNDNNDPTDNLPPTDSDNPDDDDDNDRDDSTDDDATPFDCSEPMYVKVISQSLVLPESGDEIDVYFPDEATAVELPLALLLQGALVDKQNYSNFARQVAGYGFVVAVPNHRRTGILAGLYPDLRTVAEVLAFFTAADADAASSLFGRIDELRLVLLGHSFGGAAALLALQNRCVFPFCTGGYQRPAALRGGALYGAHLTTLGVSPPIDNEGLALALVSGSRDGVATPAEVLASYRSVRTPPKALITVLGANHFAICNGNNPPGAAPDNSEPTLPQAIATETLARWSALFLRAYILADECAFEYVNKNGDSRDPNVEIVSDPGLTGTRW